MPSRPTFGMVRNSELPRLAGFCAQDISRIAAITNEAQEKLLIDPLAPDEGWWGGWASMLFNVQVVNFGAYIITPRDVARVIVLDVCKVPVRLRNAFFEYLEFGIGLQPSGCGPFCNTGCGQILQAYERDTVAALTHFPSAPQQIRVYATNTADVGRRIALQGTDQNGMIIYGVDVLTQTSTQGEIVYITDPFVTSLNSFGTLTGILKEVTLGEVQFFTVDATGTQTLLTSMKPGETVANYRRYFLNGLPQNCCGCGTTAGTVQVSAQAKIDFVPVQNDQDYLTIPNIPALIEEVQSIRYSRMDASNAPALEAKHHTKALALLNGQLDHYEGKVQTAVGLPLFGSDRLRPQPI